MTAESEHQPGDVHSLYADFAGVLPLLDSLAALRRAVTLVQQRMDVDVGAAAIRIDDDDTVEVIAAGDAPELLGLRIGPAAGLGGQAAVLRHPVAVTDYCTSTDISHHFDDAVRAADLRAVLAAPILRGHRLYGVLYAARRSPTPWTDADRHRLLELAREVALAMEVADSAREMAEVAVYTERQQWAVEMHDTVGAAMFSIRAALTKLRDDPGLPATLVDDIAHVERLAEQVSTGVRIRLRNMHTCPADKALAVALRADCRELTTRTGIRADVVILGELPPVEPARNDALLRASREALLNIEKHANANSVVLSLFSADGGVGIALADDGVGKDREAPNEPGGLGLSAAAERLERVGGRLTFAVGEDGGGIVRAWVPSFTTTPPAER